jgi:hypothetical protein
LGPPSLLSNEYRVFFPGLKGPEIVVDHHSPLYNLSPRLKEGVQLYLYFLCTFLAGHGVNITFTLYLSD